MTQFREPQLRRVLSNLRHGGHVLREELVKADPDAVAIDAPTVYEATGEPEPETTPFGYMFKNLRDFYPEAHLPIEPASTVVTGLKALGSAMFDQPNDAE